MASKRKMDRAATTARQKYVEITAELTGILAEVGGYGRPSASAEQDEAIARLRRRAGAYRAQWEAAERRAELAQEREDSR